MRFTRPLGDIQTSMLYSKCAFMWTRRFHVEQSQAYDMGSVFCQGVSPK
jgi:hypothetical protein